MCNRRLKVRMTEKVKYAAIKREVFLFFFSWNDVEMDCWHGARQSLPAPYLCSFCECYSQGQRKWVNSPFNTRYIRGN